MISFFALLTGMFFKIVLWCLLWEFSWFCSSMKMGDIHIVLKLLIECYHQNLADICGGDGFWLNERLSKFCGVLSLAYKKIYSRTKTLSSCKSVWPASLEYIRFSRKNRRLDRTTTTGTETERTKTPDVKRLYMNKKCTCCKQLKPLSEFYWNSTNSTSYSRCKKCTSALQTIKNRHKRKYEAEKNLKGSNDASANWYT